MSEEQSEKIFEAVKANNLTIKEFVSLGLCRHLLSLSTNIVTPNHIYTLQYLPYLLKRPVVRITGDKSKFPYPEQKPSERHKAILHEMSTIEIAFPKKLREDAYWTYEHAERALYLKRPLEDSELAGVLSELDRKYNVDLLEITLQQVPESALISANLSLERSVFYEDCRDLDETPVA